MARIPDSKRQAIIADIRAGQKPLRQIARDHGVSPGSVSNIAKAEGLNTAFERTATKRATEAKVADNRARRAEVSRQFLDKAAELLAMMDREHLAFSFGGRDNTYAEQKMDRPPPADLRNLIVSAAVAFDKHLAADRHDAGGDAQAVGGMLGRLLENMTERHGTSA